MEVARLCDILANQAAAIGSLTADIDDATARLQLKASEWTLLEVMCHLYDEEREDFRVRVIQTLTQPDLSLANIDPEGWVLSRGYAQRVFSIVREQFLAERQQSIISLRQLGQVAWDTHLNHPRLHELTAEQVAWAWVAHDLLHIRQLTELRYLVYQQQTTSYGYGYAGEW
ncbi:MAG: DinB family protein [Roseiflexaceae bacterium]